MDKSKVVKELFEDTGRYLKYDYNLQIRKETVLAYTKGFQFKSVLDIPSGTGAISIPLLETTDKLTMIDISSNMLSIAKSNVPEKYLQKTEIINADFFSLNLQGGQFDLIICLGLLAHVNSPEQLLTKISSLLKPGGMLILQNTDSKHFYSHLIRFYLQLKRILKKQTYPLNNIPGEFVENTLNSKGLRLKKKFRYNQSFLGFSNFFSNEKKYNLTRNFFGDAFHNKHAEWGSDVTYLFIKE